MKQFAFFCILFLISNIVLAQNLQEEKTAHYFKNINHNEKALLIFLKAMPKGADLHSHVSGATFAENTIRYAKDDKNLCLNRETDTVYSNPECPSQNLFSHAIQDPKTYHQIIDAWSMRHFKPGKESGHDHFFAAFGKYNEISKTHRGEILAEISERAASQNVLYLELMTTPASKEVFQAAEKVGWNPDFAKMREKLLALNFNKILLNISQELTKDEAKRDEVLNCKTNQLQPRCTIKVRYLYQVLREQTPEAVFALLLAGFESASKDPRIVGINMVQPEDGPISMRDYKLHMQMVGFLHELYPNVRITLHAGELNESLVLPEGLKFHINDAVNVAKADRIGHGVDIAGEDNADQLLKEMAEKGVLVEINLSSNADILGVSGKNHPLPLYLKYHVPVALSTDDEGISRADLTKQYQLAAKTYDISYFDLKTMSRNSLYYSFVPGKNLWLDRNYKQIQPECSKDGIDMAKVSSTCQNFLNSNEKAKLQWELEKRFTTFESQF